MGGNVHIKILPPPRLYLSRVFAEFYDIFEFFLRNAAGSVPPDFILSQSQSALQSLFFIGSALFFIPFPIFTYYCINEAMCRFIAFRI